MWQALVRTARGLGDALRSRPGVFAAIAAGVFTLDLFLPPILLSIVRKPVDFFTFNAWLPELPGYLFGGSAPLRTRLDFLGDLALFWFSADSPFGGVDWGFAVTVGDLARMLLLSLLFGAYFALVFHRRSGARAVARRSKRGGAAGVVASVFGLTTGGCTVMGCGAPIIPVVGLVFAGLSSGTLALLAQFSRVATIALFTALTCAVIYLAWRAGGGAAEKPALPLAMAEE
jgi:hypothetical protein